MGRRNQALLIRRRFGTKQSNVRPRLCPACGSLAGTTATKCYQCGASLRFSGAAVTRGLSRMLPTQSPVTYLMLSICCLFYGISLLLTVRIGGGGGGGFFDMGGINSKFLLRMGSSLPLPYNIQQPWRLVTAMFSARQPDAHSFQHVGADGYRPDAGGTLRLGALFIFLRCHRHGRLRSELHVYGDARAMMPSIGASGALLGLIGLMLAATTRRQILRRK